MKKVPYRFYLSEDQIPAQWYNLRADMPEQPDPMLNPATMQPAQLSDLLPVFCEELARRSWTARPDIMTSQEKLWTYTGYTVRLR